MDEKQEVEPAMKQADRAKAELQKQFDFLSKKVMES